METDLETTELIRKLDKLVEQFIRSVGTRVGDGTFQRGEFRVVVTVDPEGHLCVVVTVDLDGAWVRTFN